MAKPTTMRLAQNTYDYIIVGAGSAGCVVAHRLATAGAGRILVLEAGRDAEDEDGVVKPMRYGQAFHTDLDWAHWTPPQRNLDGRCIYTTSGKAVGGSSCIHGMAYVRPPLTDFDAWRDAGCEGWGGCDVLPYFCKSECMRGSPDWVASHGLHGPQPVTRLDPQRASKVAHAFVDASAEAGYEHIPDYNDFGAEPGVSWLQLYQDAAGARADAAKSFLWPALEGSQALTVVAMSIVDKVLFDLSGPVPRAEGVAYFGVADGGTHHHAYARRHVVLCAGAIGSPAILLRSGLGPREELKQLDIETVVELPAVGKSLQDHICCPVTFATREPLLLEALQNTLEAHLLTHSPAGRAAGGPRDIQVMQSILCEHADEDMLHKGSGFTLMAVCLYPRSRGSVTLGSASPFVKEKVDPDYLSSPADLEVLTEAVRVARAVARQPAMRSVAVEARPGEEVEGESDVKDFIVRNATTMHHCAGSCRMGRGCPEEDVVDPNLAVLGVDGLMIADASIMPTLVGANTMATCMMIGEKAAQMLLLQDSRTAPCQEGAAKGSAARAPFRAAPAGA